MSGSPSSTSFARPDLGRSFEEYSLRSSWGGFVGQRVLPRMEVGLQTANFSVIPIESLLMARNTARAPGGGYARQDWQFEQTSYSCEEHGAEELIDDAEKAIYKYTIDIEQIGADRTYDAVLRNFETRVAGAVFNATTFASYTAAVTNEWDDFANATPIDDAKTAIQAIWGNSGLMDVSLVVNWKVAQNLRLCDQIIDRIKFWGGDDPKTGNIGMDTIAAAMGVKEIIVAGAISNTAQKGIAASLSPIWSNEYAMFFKAPATQDLKEPCLGRSFDFTGDGSTIEGTVEMYREEQKRSDVVRVRHWTDELILYPQAGYLLSNITT